MSPAGKAPEVFSPKISRSKDYSDTSRASRSVVPKARYR
jgi:hypothetical protein